MEVIVFCDHVFLVLMEVTGDGCFDPQENVQVLRKEFDFVTTILGLLHLSLLHYGIGDSMLVL